MRKVTPPSIHPDIRPRIRVYAGEEVALGPGKVELLRHLALTASLRDAARQMELSYMKAWLLVQIMNRCFKKPLVTMSRGGRGGGHAEVTALGLHVLTLYDEMEAASRAAMNPAAQKLRALLRP